MTERLIFFLFLMQIGLFAIEFPPRPGDRDFIFDGANLLSDEKEQEIRGNLDLLLTEKAIPIIIVTINSLSEYDAGHLSIESYAQALFNQWGIGHPNLRVKGEGFGRSKDISWNKGILLLVSVNDRRARIELGADFGHSKDHICSQIMGEYIIPFFKKDDHEGGIFYGVQALEKMAREEQLPEIPRPLSHYLLIAGAIVISIFTVVSLVRKGSSGWAWVFWGIVLTVLWYIILGLLKSKSSSGFSGGSFGGGFSGGGGASGSW